ncbi:MAG: hypothetical protein MZV49_09790, partial [Rhodopseudomonas palustris]|nr:hypothetical protein [Rhodopseudomonas palustris]
GLRIAKVKQTTTNGIDSTCPGVPGSRSSPRQRRPIRRFPSNTESIYDWGNSQWTVPINFSIGQMIKIGKTADQSGARATAITRKSRRAARIGGCVFSSNSCSRNEDIPVSGTVNQVHPGGPTGFKETPVTVDTVMWNKK